MNSLENNNEIVNSYDFKCHDTVSTEEKIKLYYKNLVEIKRLKHKLELLIKQKEEIKNDLLTTNIELDISVKGISYDKLNIQKMRNNASQQEKAMEQAITNLEIQLKDTDVEIIETKSNIRALIKQNCNLEYIIENMIDNEDLTLLNLIYKDREKFVKIMNVLNISKTTLSNKKAKLIKEIDTLLKNNSVYSN